MPMIAPLKLQNLVPSRRPTRQTNTRHRRLGSTTDHAHLFHRRHPVHDQLCHLHFEGIRNPEAHTSLRGIAYRIDNYLRCMS